MSEPVTAAAGGAEPGDSKTTVEAAGAAATTSSTTTTTTTTTTPAAPAPTESAPAPAINLRVPSTHQPPGSPLYADFVAPEGTWLAGTWHVTHSSLPLWKDKRNVNITYVNLPNKQIQDTTAYQEGTGFTSISPKTKVKSITGVNTPTPNVPAAYDWRGKGWLMIATSHWEILGYGDVVGSESGAGTDAGEKHQWVVTYFSKTMFTPAGIDIYSRSKHGLPEATVKAIRARLRDQLQDPELQQLAKNLFCVVQTEN